MGSAFRNQQHDEKETNGHACLTATRASDLQERACSLVSAGSSSIPSSDSVTIFYPGSQQHTDADAEAYLHLMSTPKPPYHQNSDSIKYSGDPEAQPLGDGKASGQADCVNMIHAHPPYNPSITLRVKEAMETVMVEHMQPNQGI
jgi:hypothetical protein